VGFTMAGGGESSPAHSEKAIAATIRKIKGIGRDRRSWGGSREENGGEGRMATAKSERRRTADSNRVQEHQGVKLRGKIEQGSSLPRERALRLAQFVGETAGRRFPRWWLRRTPAVKIAVCFLRASAREQQGERRWVRLWFKRGQGAGEGASHDANWARGRRLPSCPCDAGGWMKKKTALTCGPSVSVGEGK
jgi:hypothetical protein